LTLQISLGCAESCVVSPLGKPTRFDYIAQIVAESKATGKPVKADLPMMATMSDTFIAEYNEAVVLLLAKINTATGTSRTTTTLWAETGGGYQPTGPPTKCGTTMRTISQLNGTGG